MERRRGGHGSEEQDHQYTAQDSEVGEVTGQTRLPCSAGGLGVTRKPGASMSCEQRHAVATLLLWLPAGSRTVGRPPGGGQAAEERGLGSAGATKGREPWGALWASRVPSPPPPARRGRCCQPVLSHKLTDSSACSNQASWRKANLTCKLAIDNVEKAELLQGGDRLRRRYGLCSRRPCGPVSPLAGFGVWPRTPLPH